MSNFEEVNWGTDEGFQQQAMVVIQYYSFYIDNYIFNMVLWLKNPAWLWFPKLNADFWIPVPSCIPGDPAHGQGRMQPKLCVSALIPASAAAILLTFPAWHIPVFQESPALGSTGALQAKERLQG